ncbi:hypothetical protein Tco_1401117 [Tanacetum coccineum]
MKGVHVLAKIIVHVHKKVTTGVIFGGDSEKIDEATREEYVERVDVGVVVMILKTSSFYVKQGGQLFVCDERAVINVYIAYHKRDILTEIIFCLAIPASVVVDNGDDDEPVYIGVSIGQMLEAANSARFGNLSPGCHQYSVLSNLFSDYLTGYIWAIVQSPINIYRFKSISLFGYFLLLFFLEMDIATLLNNYRPRARRLGLKACTHVATDDCQVKINLKKSKHNDEDVKFRFSSASSHANNGSNDSSSPKPSRAPEKLVSLARKSTS